MDIFHILIFILWTGVLSFLTFKFLYWHNRGVPTSRNNIFVGSWFQLKNMHHTALLQDLYERFKGKSAIAGFYIYTRPVAVALDMELVKSVLIKDFNKFIDRLAYKNKKDILSAHLFNLEGSKWRPLRNKLSSTFTSAKMKYMFPTMTKVAQQLDQTCDLYLGNDNIVNMSELIARYTTDVIGTCAFGIDCNSLKDPQNDIRQITKKIVGRTNFNVRWHLFKMTYVNLMKYIGAKRYPQFIEDFFIRVLQDNVMERERTGIRRNDFVDLLIDLKNTKDANGNPGLSYNEITSQLFVFFFAGFETSSGNMSFVLYLLARHPDVQEKARQEVRDKLAKHENILTYEASAEMSYLDQIISETLRLHPTLGYLERHAVEDYTIPNTNITLEKGTAILIPVKSIHYDPELYENPTEFRPERFHPSEVVNRHPQAFLGFGDGPRNCIGLRFGRMQVRVGLATLLAKYKFSICDKTVDKFSLSDHTFLQKSLDSVWLKVEKL